MTVSGVTGMPSTVSAATFVSGPMASTASGFAALTTCGQLVRVLAGHDRDVDELAGERGPPLGPPAGGAHADEVDVGMRGGAQEGDRVVGIVTDVGVDPEPHAYRLRIASSASSSSGYANSKPLACSLALDTR